MKVQVTTNCPNCEKNFTREVYEEGVIIGCCLDLCPNCLKTDEYGDSIIILETTCYNVLS